MKLKGCPFCGKHNYINRSFNAALSSIVVHWVECDECGATGPEKATRNKAEAAWNDRHSD